MGGDIRLECTVDPISYTVSWFWTRDPCQAGINGTQIRGDMAPYTAIPVANTFEFSIQLLFQVNESTVGYYWCEIMDAGVDVRPSTIVPVTSNSSL